MQAIVELNDAEVTVVRGEENRVAVRSPGVAVLNQERIELGEAALRAAHIDPGSTFSRFWSNLNLDNFKHPTGLARHNADLAFAHLLAIHEQAGKIDSMVFAVPGSFTEEQLSLLLGLVEAAPFSITGLIDSAVAATAATAAAGSYQYLDIHLHHTLVTTLEVSGSVERKAVRTLSDVGLMSIHDRCAEFIAELFIQQSRFDPLRHAETEQALHNQLPQFLSSLRGQSETLFEIQYENIRHQARISRALFMETLQPLYERIAALLEPSCVCLLHKRLAGLPGFAGHLAGANAPVETLDESAVFAGCRNYLQTGRPKQEGVYFVTRLAAATRPVVGPPAPMPAATKNQLEAGATHVLGNAEAHPLGRAPVYLSAGGRVTPAREPDSRCSITLRDSVATLALEETSAAVFVNGRAVNGSAGLRPGDVIGFDGANAGFTVIRVLV